MKKKNFFFQGTLIVFLFCGGPTQAARSSRQLITEAEPLYAKLKAMDPMRLNMALKLADLYFDASVEINAKEKMLSAAQMTQFKKRAYDYYREAFTGMNGVFKAPAGEKKDLILFQMARLSFDLNDSQRAIQSWYELTRKATRTDLKREASLRIAEIKEMSNKPADLQEALKLYDLAVSLSDTPSLKAYVLYRKAWTSYRLGQSETAFRLADQSLSLARSDDQKQILSDMILFLARSPIPAEKAISYVETYEKKFPQTRLLPLLAEAYEAADQTRSFQTVTAYLNKKDPMISLTLITLEQAYSEKNKSLFENRLSEVNRQSLNPKPFRESEDPKKAEALIYRTLVQLDGERKANTAWSQLNAPLALIYIRLFPTHENFEKIVDGTVLAVEKPEDKVKFLTEAMQAAPAKAVASQIVLRKSRLAVAQGAKMNAVILEDSEKLMALEPKQQRQYQFIHAYALKESNQPEAVEAYLQNFSWAANDELKTKTGWLYLQALESQKDYKQIIAFLAVQLKQPLPADVRRDWTAVMGKAQFEQAVVDSNDKSLAYFLALCERQENTPLSCQNAESLAQQQQNHLAYIKALELQKKYDQLLIEYERNGEFKKALATMDYLKDAGPSVGLRKLLFLELIQDKKGFEKQLATLIKAQPAAASSAKMADVSQAKKQENLYFKAAEDFSMLPEVQGLKKWSPEYDIVFAEARLAKNKSDTAALKQILKSCDGKSVVWFQSHTQQIKQNYNVQKNISLSGRQSEQNFKKRSQMLQELIAQTECLTQEFSEKEKAEGLVWLSQAYKEFADAITSVPIPKGLTEDVVAQVKEQIKLMSSPFEAKSSLIYKQAESLAKPDVLAEAKAKPAFAFERPAITTETRPLAQSCPPGFKNLQAWQQVPTNVTALQNTQTAFESCRNERIAAYMTGRLQADRTNTSESSLK